MTNRHNRLMRLPLAGLVLGAAALAFAMTGQQEVASSEPIDGADADTKPDDGWRGRANNSLTKRAVLTVEVVCAGSGSLTYVHSKVKDVLNNTQQSALARCPSGMHVTGGGVDISGKSLGIEVADTFPTDGPDADHVPGDGWRGNANNDGSGQKQHMQTFAICKA